MIDIFKKEGNLEKKNPRLVLFIPLKAITN